jgi:hypothetical protein
MPIRVQSLALSTYPDASRGSPLDQNIAVDLNERQAVLSIGYPTWDQDSGYAVLVDQI